MAVVGVMALLDDCISVFIEEFRPAAADVVMTLILCCLSSAFNSTVMKHDAQLCKQVTMI